MRPNKSLQRTLTARSLRSLADSRRWIPALGRNGLIHEHMTRIVVVTAFITHSIIFFLCVISLVWDFGIPPLTSYLVLIIFTVVNLAAAIGIACRRRWGQFLSVGFFGIHALMSIYSDLRFFFEHNKPPSSLLQFAPIVIFFVVIAILLSRRSTWLYFAK